MVNTEGKCANILIIHRYPFMFACCPHCCLVYVSSQKLTCSLIFGSVLQLKARCSVVGSCVQLENMCLFCSITVSTYLVMKFNLRAMAESKSAK